MSETPPDIIERRESGSGGITTGQDGLLSRSVELKWLIHSVTGYADAETRGLVIAPMFYFGHRRGRVTCSPLGGGWYEIAAEYANAGIDAYGDEATPNDDGVSIVPHSVSVDTTGGTEHITQAWSDSAANPDAYVAGWPQDGGGGNAPPTWGAINSSGGNVNGVDITVPSFQWSETWIVPSSYLLFGSGGGSEAYMRTLARMTGKINSDAFRGFEPGEVLFLGAVFDAQATATMTPVTFKFAQRDTRRNFAIGSIDVPIKKGWDYLWVEYTEDVDTSRLIKKPKHVYIARVMEHTSFQQLKIGTDWSQLYLTTHEFTHPTDPDGIGVR